MAVLRPFFVSLLQFVTSFESLAHVRRGADPRFARNASIGMNKNAEGRFRAAQAG